jgi:fibroblast growth factor receptor substrate 2
MGCVNTKRDDDGNQRRFHVKNLDDENRVVGEGELEVTDTHLVLYSKSQPIKWPLKYLRRYGYDDNLFSFEAGRRCPTGEGIYAFSTRNAEAIFRLVETNIRTGKSKRLTEDEADTNAVPPASETTPPAHNAVSPTLVGNKPRLVAEGNSELISYR